MVDEFSPDSRRLWDKKTKDKLEKFVYMSYELIQEKIIDIQ
ncbi:phosphoribosylaminoimidazolesuccinocarboxamide synthase [Arsenophonus endosymbiont of Aleurodicus dispersus]